MSKGQAVLPVVSEPSWRLGRLAKSVPIPAKVAPAGTFPPQGDPSDQHGSWVPLDPHFKLTQGAFPRNRETVFGLLRRGFFQTMLQIWHEETAVLKGLVGIEAAFAPSPSAEGPRQISEASLIRGSQDAIR